MIRVQVSCLAIRENRVAFVRKVNNPRNATYQKLIPPGGHVEMLETLEAAVIREMREETGLTVSDLQLRGHVSFISHVEGHPYHSVCYFFVTHSVEGEIVTNEPDTAIPQWLALEEIDGCEDVPEYHKAFLHHLLQGESFMNARVEWHNPDRRLTYEILKS